jgi:hypothetical protein
MNNVYYIGIVGADGLNKAWTPEREVEAKSVIKAILHGQCSLPYLKEGDKRVTLELVGWKKEEDIEWNKNFPIANGWRSNVILVSGGCKKKGIDFLAEEIADSLGIKKEIYPAEVNQWEDKVGTEHREGAAMFQEFAHLKKGYKTRNIQIITISDILYDIEPKGSCKHCGGKGIITSHIGEEGGYPYKCTYCKGTGNYSGGTWTLREFLRQKKEGYQIVIE